MTHKKWQHTTGSNQKKRENGNAPQDRIKKKSKKSIKVNFFGSISAYVFEKN